MQPKVKEAFYLKLLSSLGDEIFNNIPVNFTPPEEVISGIKNGKTQKVKSQAGIGIRVGYFEHLTLKGIIISNNEDYVSSSSSFEKVLEAFSMILPLVEGIKQDLLKDLLHNISTYHAHNIQELEDLVPEEDLIQASGTPAQLDVIKESLIANFGKFGTSFLRLLKNHRLLSAEMQNLNHLHGITKPTLLVPHPIHKVVQGVVLLYSSDFQDKKVRIYHDQNIDRITIDFGSFTGALIALFENAVKYAKDESVLSIKYKKSDSVLTIEIEMLSVHILPNEKERIFDRGFSGIGAEGIGKQGKGLGLFHAKKLIALSHGTVEVVPGQDVDSSNYSINLFKICLPVGSRPIRP